MIHVMVPCNMSKTLSEKQPRDSPEVRVARELSLGSNH